MGKQFVLGLHSSGLTNWSLAISKSCYSVQYEQEPMIRTREISQKPDFRSLGSNIGPNTCRNSYTDGHLKSDWRTWVHKTLFQSCMFKKALYRIRITYLFIDSAQMFPEGISFIINQPTMNSWLAMWPPWPHCFSLIIYRCHSWVRTSHHTSKIANWAPLHIKTLSTNDTIPCSQRTRCIEL